MTNDFIPASVDLEDVDANALAIVGAVARGLRRAGNDSAVVDEFRREALSGDYDHVIETAVKYTTEGES